MKTRGASRVYRETPRHLLLALPYWTLIVRMRYMNGAAAVPAA